jgi:pimeloyl-ACP methyl ester carboxylesterase
MSGRQWRKLSERLASSHRVVAPDLLGSGDNPAWSAGAPFDFHLDVAAVAELLDALGPPAHVAGHSYGGLIALTLAREHPSAVRSLALYDPVAFGVLHATGDEQGLRDLDRVAANPVFLDDARGGQEEWFEAFVDYWNGPGSWRALPDAARASFLKVGRKVYGEVRSLMGDRTPPSAYAPVNVPTLLLGGERSPVAAQRVLVQLAAALPKARIQVIPKAGHMGPLTQAGEVNALVASHIDAVEAGD